MVKEFHKTLQEGSRESDGNALFLSMLYTKWSLFILQGEVWGI